VSAFVWTTLFKDIQRRSIIMALISCIECRAVVSDKADKCGQCGCPVQLSVEQQKQGGGGGIKTLITSNIPSSMSPLGPEKVFNAKTGEELGRFSNGDTLILYLTEAITIKLKGSKSVMDVKPGMRYQMNAGGFFSAKVWLVELGKA